MMPLPEMSTDAADFLFEPAAAWHVARGRVDLFLAPITAREEVGPRSHVVRIPEAATFFGFSPTELPAGWTLMAQLAPGTRLERIDRDIAPQSSVAEWFALLATAVPPNEAVDPPSDELSLAERLESYHQAICQLLVRTREASEMKESARLKARQSEDDARLDAALRNLTVPLARSGEQSDFETFETIDNPLLRACQAIGDVQGITFPQPSEMLRGQPMRDPVSALCRSAGALPRRVVLDGFWYRREGQPLLAFRASDGRPLALLPRRGRGYDVHDPMDGSRVKVTQELADCLQPFGYCFYGGFPARPLTLGALCLFGLRRGWRDIALILLMAVLTGLLGMVLPVLTRYVFDVIIPGGQRNRLMEVGLFILAASLTSTLLGLTRGFALLRVETQVETKVQAAIWMRLLSLPASFFRQFTAGDLENRAMGISAIRQMLTSSALSSIFAGIFSVFNFLLLFRFSVVLALVASALTVIQVIALVIFGVIQLQIQRAATGAQGTLSGTLLQLVGNISKFRVSGTENRAFIVWSRIFTAYRKRHMRSARVANWFAVFSRTFAGASSMAIFWTTVQLTAMSKQTSFSIGDFLAFVAAYGSFSGALMHLGQVAVELVGIVPMYQRVKPILNSVPESNPSKQVAGELTGRIETRNLSFRYRRESAAVVRNVSLSIRANEFVAIVGASGSGKSTLIRLLLGLEKPDGGTISFDGQDVTSLDIASLRQQIGSVLQNSTPFGGDIFSNIVTSGAYTLEDAWEAARLAEFEEDLRAMPMGMHTVLGEGGVGLSGGQRQRLMIARAVVGRPHILVFDEATSALDNRTQEKIIRNLEQLRCTRIVIAHRLSTMLNADRIIVMENGAVVQSGKYQELLSKPGLFAELAKRQLTS